MTERRVAIGLCTYKRPAGLARVLAHLARAIAKIDEPVPIVVIDNDGNDPQIAGIVEDARRQSGVAIRLRVEKHPGISAARNAVIAEVDTLDVRFLAMLDDDEWPSEDWLAALLARQAETGAAVVGGPVMPVFDDRAAALRRYARFWSVAPQLLEGRPFVFCTCNFLIDLHAIGDVPRPMFELDLGLSGSEDVTFFRQLFYAGHMMAWAADAVMYEEVPADRASLAWLRRRRYSVGNQAVGWEMRDKGRWWALAKTMGVTARLAFYPLLGREADAPLVGWMLMAEQVRGRYAAHFGRTFSGYARPTGDGPIAKACR